MGRSRGRPPAAASGFGLVIDNDVELIRRHLSAVWRDEPERPATDEAWAELLKNLAYGMLEEELSSCREQLASESRAEEPLTIIIDGGDGDDDDMKHEEAARMVMIANRRHLEARVVALDQLIDDLTNGRTAQIPPARYEGADLRPACIRLADVNVAVSVAKKVNRETRRKRIAATERQRQDEAEVVARQIVAALWDASSPTVRRISERRRSALEAAFVAKTLALAAERVDLREPPLPLDALLHELRDIVNTERKKYDSVERKRELSMGWAYKIRWPRTVDGLARLLGSLGVPVQSSRHGLVVASEGLRRTSLIGPDGFVPGPFVLRFDF